MPNGNDGPKQELLLLQLGGANSKQGETAEELADTMGIPSDIALLMQYITLFQQLKEISNTPVPTEAQTKIKEHTNRHFKINAALCTTRDTLLSIRIIAQESPKIYFDATQEVLERIDNLIKEEDIEKAYNHYLSDVMDTLICIAIHSPDKGPHLAEFAQSMVKIRFGENFNPNEIKAKEDFNAKLNTLKSISKEYEKFNTLVKEIGDRIDTANSLAKNKQYDFAVQALLEAQKLGENAKEELPIYGEYLQSYINSIERVILSFPTKMSDKTH